MKAKTNLRLSFCRCPVHAFECISIDGPDSGLRLTSAKCCGQWDLVKSWPITVETMREALEFAKNVDRTERKAIRRGISEISSDDAPSISAMKFFNRAVRKGK